MDIQCHSAVSPGRSIGVVDVYLKGREYKVAGDRADSAQIRVSFYNDPNLIIRNFFLRFLAQIQDYNTPDTINAESIRNYVNIASNVLDTGVLNTVYNSVIGSLDYFNQITYNLNNLVGFASGLTGNEISPFYQGDIVIQQLNHDGDVVSETVLMNAWTSEISDIEYNDETGEVSSTSLTINYTGTRLRDTIMKEQY
jgi:hypothetical protein